MGDLEPRAWSHVRQHKPLDLADRVLFPGNHVGKNHRDRIFGTFIAECGTRRQCQHRQPDREKRRGTQKRGLRSGGPRLRGAFTSLRHDADFFCVFRKEDSEMAAPYLLYAGRRAPVGEQAGLHMCRTMRGCPWGTHRTRAPAPCAATRVAQRGCNCSASFCGERRRLRFEYREGGAAQGEFGLHGANQAFRYAALPTGRQQSRDLDLGPDHVNIITCMWSRENNVMRHAG